MTRSTIAAWLGLLIVGVGFSACSSDDNASSESAGPDAAVAEIGDDLFAQEPAESFTRNAS